MKEFNIDSLGFETAITFKVKVTLKTGFTKKITWSDLDACSLQGLLR